MKRQAVLGLLVLTVAAGAAGWSESTPLAHGSSGRYVKEGGWLVHDRVTGRFYAAKGNRTYDFLAFNPVERTWSVRTSYLAGTELKPASRGAAGCATDNGAIYATKGNSTYGFHRYDAPGNSWRQMPDVPFGPKAKKCKGGTDVVFVPGGAAGYVYLLKGKVCDFFRFDIATEQWTAMPSAPVGNMCKWDKGSWLAYDGAGTIYAHKAKIHELHRFDVATETWRPLALAGMPQASTKTYQYKKSKEGAAAVFVAGKLYAFKGGNTQEFWRYDPATQTWTELDTLPQCAAGGKKRKVKAGGDLATDGSVIYALKGGKTDEFWQYVPETLDASHTTHHARTGVQGEGRSQNAECRLQIVQNPARGRATVRLSGPLTRDPGPLTLSLYDASGRLVFRCTVDIRQSTFDISLRPGVYTVRLTGDGFALARQLVVN